jgi:hypothetical protein
VAWLTGDTLAFAPRDGGLLTMTMTQGNAQAALLGDDQVYRLPALAPDGRLLAFQRDPRDAAIPEGYGALIALEPGPRAAPDVLGADAVDLRGSVRWGPDAALMVAFEGGILLLFDPATGQGLTLPIQYAVAYAWGQTPALTPEATPEPTSAQP